MRRLVIAATTVALAALLAACGSSSPASGGTGRTSTSATSSAVASASSSTHTSASSSTTASSGSGAASAASGGALTAPSPAAIHARLQLASCFRAHGIDIPNPTSTGHLTAAGRRALRNYPRTRVKAALQACRADAARAFAGPSLSLTQRTQLVKFAGCLRSHGVRIPKLRFRGNGLLAFRLALRKVDRSSSSFQSAFSSCRDLLPHFARSGG
ncbi:MAG TPA: hypothetical protein VGF70_08800 [Solirubrobacteraceae bacterium]